MTYWEALRLSIWPAIDQTIDVLVYLWSFYCLVKWACSWWHKLDEYEYEDEEFDPFVSAAPSGTGEPRPIRRYHIGELESRDGERE